MTDVRNPFTAAIAHAEETLETLVILKETVDGNDARWDGWSQLRKDTQHYLDDMRHTLSLIENGYV